MVISYRYVHPLRIIDRGQLEADFSCLTQDVIEHLRPGNPTLQPEGRGNAPKMPAYMLLRGVQVEDGTALPCRIAMPVEPPIQSFGL